jgi:ATP-dependent helicase Lhr and Lhr-like helicase
VSTLESPDLTVLPASFARWFAARGWTPRPHQLELLARARAGRSVLLIAPTGGGKTLAGFLPTLVELSEISPRAQRAPSPLAGEDWGGGYETNSVLSGLPPSRPPPLRQTASLRSATSPARGEVKKEKQGGREPSMLGERQ